MDRDKLTDYIECEFGTIREFITECDIFKINDTLFNIKKVTNYWQPDVSKSERYYYVNYFGIVMHSHAHEDSVKRYRIFKTEDEAEKYAEYVKAEEVLKAEIARLNEGWLPNWVNSNELKYYVRIDSKELKMDYFWNVKVLPTFMYLKSGELTIQLIRTHAKELRTYLSY